MTLIITYINTGMDNGYLNRFMKAWVVGLPIAIAAAFLVGPFAKISDGFSILYPALACIFFMFICLFSLSKAMTVIPVGFTYATYGGLTITAVTILGIFKYNQLPNIYGIIGIVLIIIGVILVNYLGKVSS